MSVKASEDVEQVELGTHEWNVIMDILRVDIEANDAPARLGDVANQASTILQKLEKQLGRDGVERH